MKNSKHFCFEDSVIERNLDKMFNLESLGLEDEDTLCDFEKEQIKQFAISSSFNNDAYYIELLRNKDKLRLLDDPEQTA